MHKKQSIFIALVTASVILILSFFVGFTIISVNRRITQYCYDELANTAKQLASDLYDATETDWTILSAMAAIISGDEHISDSDICEIMNAYNTSVSYISYIELLRPDGTMLDSDGTIRDVSDAFDYSLEAQKGTYVSNIEQSTLDPDESVIRNAVPVKRNGETIFMLYGVVKLSDLAEKYTTDIYDNHAYVYLVDGDTGDFILDTWHKSLGNISDLSDRRMISGYSFDEAIADIKNGVSGNLGFISKSTGHILYMHYEPVSVNNWSVVISIEKGYALQKSESISSSLYWMAGVIGAVMLLYIVSVSMSLFRAYRQVQKLGTEDQTTGLKTRNAYDEFISKNQRKTFDSIVCIYLDANGLHEVNNKYGHAVGDQMLRIIADALKSEFSGKSIYRIGGDEFVVFCDGGDLDVCGQKMKKVIRQIESFDYYASFGIVCRKNEMGVDRITQEADAQMLENKRLYYVEHDRRQDRRDF